MLWNSAHKHCCFYIVMLCCGPQFPFLSVAGPTLILAEEPDRLTFRSIERDASETPPRAFGDLLLHPNNAEALFEIRYRLAYEEKRKEPSPENSNQIVYRYSRHEYRANRARQLDNLLAHQNALKKLATIGYAVKYENNNRVSTGVQAPFVTRNSAYVRNVLAERIVVPVVAISPYRWAWCKHFDRDFYQTKPEKMELNKLTAEMLLPFTQVRLLDLSASEFSLKDFETLQALPQLETLHLSREMLEPEMRDNIQFLLPRCNLKDPDGMDPDWELKQNSIPD